MSHTKVLWLGLLAASVAVTGCSNNAGPTDSGASPQAETTPAPANPQEHAHGTGPNGGVVFDLGKYHAEFTVDHPKAQCTILILGDDEKTPTPIDAKELTLSIKETKTEEGKAVPPMTIKMLPARRKRRQGVEIRRHRSRHRECRRLRGDRRRRDRRQTFIGRIQRIAGLRGGIIDVGAARESPPWRRRGVLWLRLRVFIIREERP